MHRPMNLEFHQSNTAEIGMAVVFENSSLVYCRQVLGKMAEHKALQFENGGILSRPKNELRVGREPDVPVY